MRAMRQFLITLILVWTAASIGAFVYSQQQHIPHALVVALLPAILLEVGLYLMPGFEGVRRLFDGLAGKRTRAALLVVSAVTPYLIESTATTTFRPVAFVSLLAVTACAAFWYALLKPSVASDVGFLLFMAVVYMSRAFPEIYVRPAPHLQIEILGKLMWIRLGVMSVLSLRRIENVRFGFLPTLAEWRTGIVQFLLFLPVAVVAAYILKFARFHPHPWLWWQFLLFVPGTFLGFLWVVALSEEFFFRGLLLQTISQRFHSKNAGLVISSVVFGSAHLLFPSFPFPNWRFAIIAGLAGLFYGVAYLQTRSIRASMVTHALVVTAWKSLFAG